MELLYKIQQWHIAILGFVAWIIFVPQLTRLIKIKNADALSMVLLVGSVYMQGNLLIYGFLQGLVDNIWSLVFMYTPAAILIILVTGVTIELKHNPNKGGLLTSFLDRVGRLLKGLTAYVNRSFRWW